MASTIPTDTLEGRSYTAPDAVGAARDDEDDADAPARQRAWRPSWARHAAVASSVVVGACLIAVVGTSSPAEVSSDRLRSSDAPALLATSTSTSTTLARRTAVAAAPGPTDALTAAAATSTIVTLPEVLATPATTAPPAPPPADAPVVARPVPSEGPNTPAPAGPPPPWAGSITTTAAGYVGTSVGCASSTLAGALDAFFAARLGPVMGHDYQHVYPLGGDRYLWLFQDTFLDYGGTATTFDEASFVHNTAMVQRGTCFTLLHRGTSRAPASFEPGTGERRLSRWFWPLGGETSGNVLRVFWAEMAKTSDPVVPDGLGWVPMRTWLATYDTTTLARIDLRPAPADGVAPIYGYAVASDADHTYLFGNTFDQNLERQGGYRGCPCSATSMWLARVPRGQLDAAPEFRTADGWSSDPGAARPFLTRYHAENPMQPRFLAGQWVAVTKVDGYWAEELAVDVALHPWGPWHTVARGPLAPRDGDPRMNTYHAHLAPWLDGSSLVVSTSQNARDMQRDAWPHPERYRLQFFPAAFVPPPPAPAPLATTVTTPPTETTTAATTSSTTTTSTSTSTTTSTTTTTVPDSTTSTALAS